MQGMTRRLAECSNILTNIVEILFEASTFWAHAEAMVENIDLDCKSERSLEIYTTGLRG
jgi:hypothetical protein